MNVFTSVLRQQLQKPSALPRTLVQRAPTTIVRPTSAIRHYATVRKEHTSASRTINFILGTSFVVAGVVGISYGFDSRASIHKYVFVPLLHWTMDPETAHQVGIKLLKTGLSPRDTQEDDPSLEVKVGLALTLARSPTLETRCFLSRRTNHPPPLPASLPAFSSGTRLSPTP